MNKELADKLHAAYLEEIQDHEKYLALAKECEEAGCHKEAGILRDIANEEESHAHFVNYILTK